MSLIALPEAKVRDRDLLDRIAAARGQASYQFVQMECEMLQRERDTLKALPRDKRRRLATQEALAHEPVRMDDMRHIHSVLAICGLPYRRLPTDVRDFERRQGNMALDVTAGFLRGPDGSKVIQPIPFGPKARLILMHLCSEAIRQKSPTIDIADTFTGFVRDLGFADSGGLRGPLTAFKEQLNALSACTMRMSVWTGERVRTRTITPIEEIDLWMAANPEQRSLWPSTVTFSQAMYDSLKRHALPVNVKAVRAFAGSARKLDIFFWLGYRLYNISTNTLIPWTALSDQFGDGYSRPRDFAAAFHDDVKAIVEVFPKLPIKMDEFGIHLSPADPEMLALPVQKTKKIAA